MGNNKSFKKKTTPKRSYPNTYDYEGSATDEKEISFYLVQIDRVLAKTTMPGNTVELYEKNNRIEVHSQKGRIGNVPPSKIEMVKSIGILTGTITEISKDLDRIKITLKM